MKSRRRIVQRLLTTLLCLALCAADIIPTGMTVLAQEQEVQSYQEEADAADKKDLVSEEEMEAEEPAEDKPPVIEGNEEAALPTEEEPESVSENAVEEDVVEEDVVVEETPDADFVMTASDGDIASGVYLNTTWNIDANGKLTVNGEGDFVDPSYKDCARAPWYRDRSQIKTAEISLTGVTNASYMFYNCRNLTSIDMTNFDTSSVTDMRGMFNDCVNLTRLDLGRFNTDSVTDMSSMFSYCEKLETLDLSNFDTSKVTDMNHIFFNCRSLTELGVSNFDTSEVTDMNNMFYYCRSLTTLEVSNFNTSKVTDMAQMFEGCSSLTTLEVSNFVTSNVTNMRYMFKECGKLSTLNVSNFNTKNVTEMDAMFCGCASLTALEVSNFDTGSVTNMYWMFRNCVSLTELDLSHFNTGNVTDMSYMFYGCRKLTKLDVSSEFHTGSVTDMELMFRDCESLPELDLSYFDTSSVTNMREMFSGCSKLIELDLSSFDTQNVTDITGIFDDCSDLNCIHTPCNLTQSVRLPAESGDIWYHSDGTVVTELPKNLNYSVTLKKNSTPVEFVSGTSNNISWMINADGKLTVSGTGDYKRIDGKYAPWYDHRNSIKTAEIDVKDMFDASYMFYDCENLTDIDLTNFDAIAVSNMRKMFCGCSKLTKLELNLYTYFLTDMSGMFSGCTSLTELTTLEFSTDKVTDMSSMFYGCTSLSKLVLDFRYFSTGSVTDMSNMFYGCEALTELDLKDFDTRNVTNMSNMFSGCEALTELDLNNFDVGNVTDMFDFSGCKNLTYIYTPRNVKQSVELPSVNDDTKWYRANGTEVIELPKNLDYTVALRKNDIPAEIASDKSGDISWVIDADKKLTVTGTGDFEEEYVPWHGYCDIIRTAEVSVKDMTDASGIFQDCRYLTKIDLAEFDTSKVTDMSDMFSGCESLTTLDLSSFDTAKVTNMSGMFCRCTRLTTLDVSSFNTSSVKYMHSMFYNCKSLTKLELGSFDTGSVTDMSKMFFFCESLAELNLSNFNTGSVTDMHNMFDGCKSLAELDLSNFNTGSVTNMSFMFSSCRILRKLDISSFNTGSVTDMHSMFHNCFCLTTLDVSNFDTSKVTNMSYMFLNCGTYAKPGLTELDVSNFNTGSVTDMHGMFAGCSNLVTLDLTKFDTSKVTDMNSMFHNCKSLTKLDLSNFDMNKVTDISDMFSDCSKLITIHTPRNVKQSVELPSEPGDKWYLADGTIVTELPQGLDTSVTLEKNRNPIEEKPDDPKEPEKPEEPEDPKEPEEPQEPENITSGKSGNISWEIADGKLTVSGTGDFERMDVGSGSMRAPWYHARNAIKTAVINVTGMSDASYMFYECENLTDIDLSNFNTSSVTDMKTMFSGCSKLTTIHTPRNVKQSVELPSEPGDKWYLPDGTVVTELPRDLDYSVVLIKNQNPNEGKPDTPDDDPKGDNDSDVPDEDIPEDGKIPEGLWISGIADCTYTGTEITPEVRVYEGKTKLTQGTDYTLSYKNNTKAARADDVNPPAVVVKGRGNYSGTETKTFTITKCDISDTYVTKIFTDAYTPLANGKNPTLVFSAKYNNKALKKNTDYTLTVKDNAGNEVTSYGAEGIYLAVVKGTGANYTGEYTFPFEVLNKIPVSKLKISKIAAVKYDGTSKTPEPVIKYGKVTLNKETDYSLSYHDNTEIGTATVTVEGKGDYFGKRNVTFSITGLPIKQAKFTGFIKSFPYTGDKVYQSEAVLTYGEEKLVKDTDYTVSYSNCLNKGKAAVTYTGIGKYTGTIKKTYSITAFNIAANAGKRITLSKETISAAYTKGGARPSLKVYDGTRLLTEGRDYTLSYQNNAAVTTSATVKQPTITVKGMGNYAGTFSEKKTFTITAKDIAEVTVTVPDVAASTKTGKYKSTPVLTDTNGKKLKAGTDYDKAYTYTYKNTTEKVVSNGAEVTRNAGDPVEEHDIIPANTVLCIRIKAKEGGNYTGETTAEYRVATSLINRAKITVQNPAQNNKNLFPYTGQAIRLEKSSLIVKVGTEVLSGDQYEILENTYKNNVGKGTASVQIRGVGNYGGTATVKFKIGTKSFHWVK